MRSLYRGADGRARRIPVSIRRRNAGSSATNSAASAPPARHRPGHTWHVRRKPAPRPARCGGGEFDAILPRNCSASRQASRKSSFRTPTGAEPITSRGPVTGKAATGRPLASASSSTRPNVSVRLGKHEDIGGRIDLAPVPRRAARPGTPRPDIPLQRRARRAVADDDLGAGQIEVEEGLEILFDRDAADAEEDRPRQAEIDAARMKQRGIDAARPQHHVAKAARAQFGRQRRRRRHHRLARPVKPAQRRARPSDSGIGERAETYSGKRV